MKKILLFILLVYTGLIFADFIIPPDDPVYIFLEMTNTIGLTELRTIEYPLYYNMVLRELTTIVNGSNATPYQKIADYHLNRLKLYYPIGTNVAVYPPKKTFRSVKNLLSLDPAHQRLFSTTGPADSISTNETFIYASGLLGFEYDTKIRAKNVNRNKKYYGVESAGNFTDNFGYYFLFQKGHYLGEEDFIKEYPFLTTSIYDDVYSDENGYYFINLITEVDFKNPYLNFSIGYGSLDIGRSISSSIILNSDVTPYGYIKYYKNFGIIDYLGITSQLIPEKKNEDNRYEPKSMGIQVASLNTDNFTFGLGNAAIYGDKVFDIAYSTPLSVAVAIDSKYGSADNALLLFGFTEIKYFTGFNLYGSFLFDDISKNRLKSDKGLSYTAYQAGILHSLKTLPLDFGIEATIVGPSTYSHESSGDFFTYTHDKMRLGHKFGSNFLSLATRIRWHIPRLTTELRYENVQQGDIGCDPLQAGGEQKFLAGNFTRKEIFTSEVNLRIISELHLFTRYEYQNEINKDIHYIYTGMEFKY